MARRLATIAVVLAAGLALWRALQGFAPSGAERFYLVVPPVALALAFLCGKSRREWLRTRGLLVLWYAGVVGLLSLVGGYKSAKGASDSLDWSHVTFNTRENLLAGYLLLAVLLLLEPIHLLIRRGVEWLEEKWRGPLTEKVMPPGRSLVRRYVPLALLLPLIVPYLLGVVFIHRLKVPVLDPAIALAGRPFEDVTLKTADGYRLSGWFLPAAGGPSHRTLLICHGLEANRCDVLGFVAVGDAIQANTLVFDFRGHGQSQGHTISLGRHETFDVLAAIDYLRRERPSESRELYGLGLSMGSGALVHAAALVEPPLEALVLDSGFATALELSDHALAGYPTSIRPCLLSVGLPLASLHAGCRLADVRPIDQVARVRAPVLIIHAGGDDLIPADHARRLFASAAEPKSLWITSDGGHVSAFAFERAEYLRRVRTLVAGEPAL